MSVEIDRPVLTEHGRKVSLDDVKIPLDERPEAGRPGWIDMDVRWIVTRDTVGSDDSVFGLTYFPPGSRHEIHRHENAEEVEHLISGEGVARVGDTNLPSDGLVYVTRARTRLGNREPGCLHHDRAFRCALEVPVRRGCDPYARPPLAPRCQDQRYGLALARSQGAHRQLQRVGARLVLQAGIEVGA